MSHLIIKTELNKLSILSWSVKPYLTEWLSGASGQMCRVLHQQRGQTIRDPTLCFARHSNMLLEQKRNRIQLKYCLVTDVETAACMLSSCTVRKHPEWPLSLFSFISFKCQSLWAVDCFCSTWFLDPKPQLTTGSPTRSYYSLASNMHPGIFLVVI